MMKKAPSPRNFPSSQRQENFILRDEPAGNSASNGTRSALKYFKVAAKKVAGAFAVVLFWRKKVDSKYHIADSSRNIVRTRGNSVSIDPSSGSSAKSSSIFKSSSSGYSSCVFNGQVGNFSIEEIYKATENFSPANIIGEGGFGTVYKGRLRDGTLVAIKRARKNKHENHLEFKNEMLTLSTIEHLNLVRLYGYLEHEDEKIILLEYVSNGTLREHLDGTLGKGLEIAERLEIAIDIAHAVTYLHMYTDHPIIHRDIKASNILITEKLRAKVADFGFARLGSTDPDATHVSTQVKGTAGYLDPDYLRTNQLTDKSDVYSFGVLLVELMTGRKPIETKRSISERVTIRWAIKKLNEGEAVIAMDQRLQRSPESVMAVEKVLKLAHLCLVPTRKSRPSMKQCVEVLWNIRKDVRERSSSHSLPPSSPQSANFPERDAKKSLHISFGVEDGDSYKFISA
ncbi:calmodulin-binding receptor-like cytoplasmic kinase 2 isoform X1 [Juglans regia]|uniref:non-specific serine/threonine protein kinase n=3 Tax=Juglans regia TaxID=51240 RepID=A0A6P9DZ41_JUGRE|nr:calmodulin-binding receptor-like cytoplasmic kinase 2 isoform X1 [Juglans regia]